MLFLELRVGALVFLKLHAISMMTRKKPMAITSRPSAFPKRIGGRFFEKILILRQRGIWHVELG